MPIPTPPKSLTKIVGKMTSAELELNVAKEDAIIENAEIIIYDMLTHLAEKINATAWNAFSNTKPIRRKIYG